MYTLKNVKYIKRGRQVCIYHTKFKREKKKSNKKIKNKSMVRELRDRVLINNCQGGYIVRYNYT